MKQSTILIAFLSIIILGGISWFLIQNKPNNADHGEERLIEEYDIHCNEGNHIESFYHDPSSRDDLIPIEEFYTLDIYCVDENSIKNGIYYKFRGDTQIEKGHFLNGQKDGERNSYVYNRVVNYKNGKRDGIVTYYFSGGAIMNTGAYVNGKKEGQWTFYHENGNIFEIDIYSGGDLIKVEKFHEDENNK